MADEITVSCSLSVTKSGVTTTKTLAATTFDQTGTRRADVIQTIGELAFEALSLGEVVGDGTPGWAYIQNLDSTHFVEIKGATGDANPVIQLEAGAANVIQFDSLAVPVAQADTAAVDLLVLALET